MTQALPPVLRLLMIASFLAVASSAGLQWAERSANVAAVEQQASRRSVSELSQLLQEIDAGGDADRPRLNERFAEAAERVGRHLRGDSLVSATRRVAVLSSAGTNEPIREKEMQDRLRAELRGLVREAEHLEASALGRAAWLSGLNQALLVLAAALCGLTLFQASRISRPA